jgi:hypothetical protein
VDYYLRMSAVIRLVLDYTEAFDPAQIEAAIAYVQNWRAQTSVRALEETGQSLENELGRLNYALASKTDDLTAYRAALEAFVAFEKSPKTAQADIPVAARNQGLALKEIGVLTGELDTLRAAWHQLDRAYHLEQDPTDVTQILLDRGDLEFHISYHSQQGADFAQGAKTYKRLADAIAPAGRDVDWAYLMLNKATMLHQFATTNADVAALHTASEAYGAAAEVFATHGTPAEANPC